MGVKCNYPFLSYITSSLFTNFKINNPLLYSVLYMSLPNKPVGSYGQTIAQNYPSLGVVSIAVWDCSPLIGVVYTPNIRYHPQFSKVVYIINFRIEPCTCQ
jgi:hypothetical protein